VRKCLPFLAVALTLVPSPAPAQGLPFDVPIIGWQPRPHDLVRKAYRNRAVESEILYCIDSWRVAPEESGSQAIIVTHVREAYAGSRHRLADVDAYCVSANGKPLPTLHTHSDGNCQFSPADLRTAAARRAPFEGIQCGVRHFVWVSSWQIVAMANGLEGRKPPRIDPP
jgi:hypothetical protein